MHRRTGTETVVNPKIEKKYQKGLKLESIFDPGETRRLEEQELQNISHYTKN